MAFFGETRNPVIDCLRGFSVLTVISTHGGIYLPSEFITPAVNRLLYNGYYGVVIFFVISGFLITTNTLRRYGEISNINLGQFYAMRVARIMPPLLLFIAAMILLAYFGPADFRPEPVKLVWTAAYKAITFQYTEYVNPSYRPGLYQWIPLWSLSVEEICYILFPFLCLLCRRAWIFAILLFLVVATGPLRRHNDIMTITTWQGAVDHIALGCLIAIVTHHVKSSLDLRWLGRPAMLLGFAILAYAFLQHKALTDFTYMPTLVAAGAASILFGTSLRPEVGPATGVALRPLVAVGRASYEMYIFHWSFQAVMRPTGFAPSLFLPALLQPLAATALFVGVVFVFSSLVARFYSEPLNAWIRSAYARYEPHLLRQLSTFVEYARNIAGDHLRPTAKAAVPTGQTQVVKTKLLRIQRLFSIFR